MKRCLSLVIMISISLFFTGHSVLLGKKKTNITERIAKGAYVPQIAVTARDVRNLPVPTMQEDYAILQAVDNYCNIIIGRFSAGNREIELIQDWDADGTVDMVVHWNSDRDSFRYEPKPGNKYSPEKFKELKTRILEGNTKDLKPNKEGTPYILSLIKKPTNIIRWLNGYRVSYTDPDRSSFEMYIFSFSHDALGADLVYQVEYRYIGKNIDRPIINYSVYCNDSKDPFINEYTKDLIKKTSKEYSR